MRGLVQTPNTLGVPEVAFAPQKIITCIRRCTNMLGPDVPSSNQSTPKPQCPISTVLRRPRSQPRPSLADILIYKFPASTQSSLTRIPTTRHRSRSLLSRSTTANTSPKRNSTVMLTNTEILPSQTTADPFRHHPIGKLR
jgi:hypothetical protein